jgi:hypothetical protein
VPGGSDEDLLLQTTAGHWHPTGAAQHRSGCAAAAVDRADQFVSWPADPVVYAIEDAWIDEVSESMFALSP